MSSDFIEGKPVLRLTFGGTNYVLPWETGVQILNLMKDAIQVQQKYESGVGYVGWVNVVVGSEVTATAFSPAEQAQLMMGGDNG